MTHDALQVSQIGEDHERARRPPAPTSDLPYLSAIDALDAFRSRALSPVELLNALIERAEQVEPQVNAFAETMFEEVSSRRIRSPAWNVRSP